MKKKKIEDTLLYKRNLKKILKSNPVVKARHENHVKARHRYEELYDRMEKMKDTGYLPSIKEQAEALFTSRSGKTYESVLDAFLDLTIAEYISIGTECVVALFHDFFYLGYRWPYTLEEMGVNPNQSMLRSLRIIHDKIAVMWINDTLDEDEYYARLKEGIVRVHKIRYADDPKYTERNRRLHLDLHMEKIKQCVFLLRAYDKFLTNEMGCSDEYLRDYLKSSEKCGFLCAFDTTAKKPEQFYWCTKGESAKTSGSPYYDLIFKHMPEKYENNLNFFTMLDLARECPGLMNAIYNVLDVASVDFRYFYGAADCLESVDIAEKKFDDPASGSIIFTPLNFHTVAENLAYTQTLAKIGLR